MNRGPTVIPGSNSTRMFRSPGVGPRQDLAGPFSFRRAADGPGYLVDGPLKVQKDLELPFDRKSGQLRPVKPLGFEGLFGQGSHCLVRHEDPSSLVPPATKAM